MQRARPPSGMGAHVRCAQRGAQQLSVLSPRDPFPEATLLAVHSAQPLSCCVSACSGAMLCTALTIQLGRVLYCCRLPHWSVALQSSSSITQVRAQTFYHQAAATQQLSPELSLGKPPCTQSPTTHAATCSSSCKSLALCPLHRCGAACVLRLHTACTSPSPITTRANL